MSNYTLILAKYDVKIKKSVDIKNLKNLMKKVMVDKESVSKKQIRNIMSIYLNSNQKYD